MLGEQTIVMHAEFGVLDHGALARPTVPQQRSTARKRLHQEMGTRTYVRARATQRAALPGPAPPGPITIIVTRGWVRWVLGGRAFHEIWATAFAAAPRSLSANHSRRLDQACRTFRAPPTLLLVRVRWTTRMVAKIAAAASKASRTVRQSCKAISICAHGNTAQRRPRPADQAPNGAG
jgi:hypothetical protein